MAQVWYLGYIIGILYCAVKASRYLGAFLVEKFGPGRGDLIFILLAGLGITGYFWWF